MADVGNGSTNGVDSHVIDGRTLADGRSSRESEFERLCAEARSGSVTAVGELLESCRKYLLLVANITIRQGLRGKIGASDLVQEAFTVAHQNFQKFEGTSQEELLRWLNRILEYKIGNTLKYYRGAARRDLSQEVHLDAINALGSTNHQVQGCELSPISQLCSKEEVELYRDAVMRLSDEQREIIRLRVDENLSFEEIGLKTQRSSDAARKLYGRTIARLQLLVGNQHVREE